jgi:NADPH:quinone reductase-like Zn-dependent oxidoreductase
MRAAYYEQNGAAREVLRVAEVDTPQPGPGEVRVKLLTSGVNPSDVKSRQGTTRKIAWPRLIPQSDGAGVIDQVGDGIAKTRLGERVWIWNGQWRRAFGTAAEYIALPAAQAVKLPETIGFEAGADHTIDYKREDVGERVMEITGRRGVDAVIEMDLATNAKLIPFVLRPKGSVIVYGTDAATANLPAFFCLTNSIRVQFFLVYELNMLERERAVSAIGRALEQGRLMNRIGPTFPLAEIAAAHEAVERGTIGNVIVTL